MGLVEPSFKDNGPLVHIGVDSIWRLLELHGSLSVNQICRLLATSGLAANLVTALQSATAQARLLESRVKLLVIVLDSPSLHAFEVLISGAFHKTIAGWHRWNRQQAEEAVVDQNLS